MKFEKQIFRSIRTKTAIILILLFLFLVVTSYVILNTVMLSSIRILENRYIEEHMKRAVNTIESDLIHYSQTAHDWAVWDDTYEFIQDVNQSYIESNLNDETLINIGADAMVMINNAGDYVFAADMDPDNKIKKPVSQDFINYINSSPIMKNTDSTYKVKGLIVLPEGPVMIVSSPILSSSGKGPVHGNLVIGHLLDDSEMDLFSSRLNLELEAYRLDQLDLSKSKLFNSLTKESSILVREIDEDNIGGYTILTDIYGQPAVGLSLEMDREISIIGREGIKYVLYYLIGACFIFSILIIIFLDRTILSRLSDLSKEIRKIGSKENLTFRLKPQKLQDELTVVSEEINYMLDHIENSQLELFKVNENLKEEIAEREVIQEEIKYLAYHDHLTGLPNRLLFNDYLNHAIFMANRTKKALAVMFLDLDGFKMINDTMGHAVGDELLIEVSNRLIDTLRKSDTVDRIGGDEFGIMIENLDDMEYLDNEDKFSIVAEKILGSFKEPFTFNNQDCFITTSVGVALYPTDGEDAEVLTKNADIAMYMAKEKGKNQYIFCTQVMKTKINETMKMTNSLYRALERNELEIYYQPQLSCTSTEIVGLEALLRWNHPEFGMVSPSEFIPIAERTGLIIPIGEWVLRTACQQNKAWQEEGYTPLRVGVNISVQQFQNPNLIQQVKGILEETGLASHYLELEITESIAMKEKNYIIETLTTFRDMGIHISIDDFGTEYSSMDYLKQLPIDRIKIAMPFVHGIDVSKKDEAITKSIIILAKSMGFSVIAEGVETKKQLEFLTERKCDEIQGYYFYRPLPLTEVTKLLK